MFYIHRKQSTFSQQHVKLSPIRSYLKSFTWKHTRHFAWNMHANFKIVILIKMLQITILYWKQSVVHFYSLKICVFGKSYVLPVNFKSPSLQRQNLGQLLKLIHENDLIIIFLKFAYHFIEHVWSLIKNLRISSALKLNLEI